VVGVSPCRTSRTIVGLLAVLRCREAVVRAAPIAREARAL
jgi:hypothetical protein